jgi:hypothetical protein
MTSTEAGHVEELLDAYRTGELDDARRASVAAHLEACAHCRAALERLGPWTEVVELGFAARRAAARDLEPDWAAQRAAIVARTSGRAHARAAEGRRGFWRWAPQVALVALAALIVGIVWRENPRDPALRRATESRTVGTEARDETGAEAGRDDAPPREVDAAAPAEAGARRDVDAAPRPQAPPAAAGEAEEVAKAAPEEAEALGQAGNERREVFADRAPEVRERAVGDGERFEDRARAALAARDTVAARRALAFWDDSLSPAERGPARAALADSLEALLAGGP